MASFSFSSRKLSESSSSSSSPSSNAHHRPLFPTSLHNSPSSSPPPLPNTSAFASPITSPHLNPTHGQFPITTTTTASTTLTKFSSPSPSEVDPKPLPPPPFRLLDGHSITAKTSPRSVCAGEPRRSSFKLQYRQYPKSTREDDPFLLAIRACSKDTATTTTNNNDKEKKELEKDYSDEDGGNDGNDDDVDDNDDGRLRDLGSKLVSKLIMHRRQLPYLCSYALVHETHLPTRVVVVSSSSSSSSSSHEIGNAKSSSSAVSTAFPVMPTTNINKTCKVLEGERNHGCTGQLEGVDLHSRRLPMIPRKSHGRIAREALDSPEPTFVAPTLTNKSGFSAECMKRTRVGHHTRKTTMRPSSLSSSASSLSKESRSSSHVRECLPVSVSCGQSNYNSRAIVQLVISPIKRKQSVADWIGCKSANAAINRVLLPSHVSMATSSPTYSGSKNTFKA